MELGPLDQMQGQAQAVGGHLPLFGKVGMRIPLVVVLERARKKLRAGDARGDAGTQAGVQRNGVLRPGHRERAPVGMASAFAGTAVKSIAAVSAAAEKSFQPFVRLAIVVLLMS